MTNNVLVTAKKINHIYGKRQALHEIDFDIFSGEILALVGANGAGKSTLLKILAGFLRPTAGKMEVFGYEPYIKREKVMRKVRFAFAPPPLYDNLTAWENMEFLVRLGLPKKEYPQQQEIERVLSLVGLKERVHDRVAGFSFGMRQRLILAQALLPMPELLVLDEPTDGLDPLAIRELRVLLCKLRDEHQVTILLSSHLLSEIEKIADRVLFIHEGKKIFYGNIKDLIKTKSTLQVKIHGDITMIPQIFPHAKIESNHTFQLQANTMELEEMRDTLQHHDIKLCEFYHHKVSLEDAFLEELQNKEKQNDL
ncbi:ABC transporter ATP-binding protein [Candidatus Uabimicrobium amorphum]|uniref:Bacitracin ABC transporter ATP-binding protein n=1 Tax=Uabimicrobium amorphum TaxID=2596890 RepID=A0A5S9IPU1_UABAM|nr:ABC transporter ATP-binding protein [Candidatus Uabimicrobium amorphum]BBM85487.1 bacitracin ABC transporter ATP-binding protein [Candidatus Uabimicrobium amorphum]